MQQTLNWQRARTEPSCPQDGGTGLATCRWPATFSILVAKSWTSGLYLVILTNADRYQSAVPFAVRDDRSRSALIYLQPVMTYQAAGAD